MGYHINKVEWDIGKELLQQIRERVFVCELHIPKHIRNRSVYRSLLNYIVELAQQQGCDCVSINCILNEVERFKRNGFEQQGCVFMEAGIPRLRMQCPINKFNTKPFTLVH